MIILGLATSGMLSRVKVDGVVDPPIDIVTVAPSHRQVAKDPRAQRKPNQSPPTRAASIGTVAPAGQSTVADQIVQDRIVDAGSENKVDLARYTHVGRGPDAASVRRTSRGLLRTLTTYRVLVVAQSDDGRLYRAEGRSPSLSLPVGSYSVSVMAPEVFLRRVFDITVFEDRSVFLPALPAAVRVRVTDVPGNAMVQFDDYPPFRTGWSRDVTVGKHEVTFTWPRGERLVMPVEITHGGQTVAAARP